MSEEVTTTEAAHPRLKRQLGLVDLVLAQVMFVVGAGWVGAAAGLGRTQAVMWVLAMLVFYAPMALAVIHLNREMPLEGGLYAWARIAYGDFVGFLVAWNVWVYSVMVAAVVLFAFPTEIAYTLAATAGHLPDNQLASLTIAFVLLLLIALAAALGLDVGKWLQNLGGVAILAVFLGLILLPLVGLCRHQGLHWEPLPVALPKMNVVAMARLGQMMIGGLAGLEYIAILAGETRSPGEAIGRSVRIASPMICAMFILGTSAVMAYQKGAIDLIAPAQQTFRLALGASGLGGAVALAAIVFLQLREFGTASLVFTGATRLALTAGWDHLLPKWFTRLSRRRRTPTNAILFTAVLVMLILALGSAGVRAQEAFQVMLNAGTAHYALAYMAMFALPTMGITTLRSRFPAWLKWVCGVGFVATLFSLVMTVFPFVEVVNPITYGLKILVPTLVSNLAAALFYWARRSSSPPALAASQAEA